MSDIVDSDRRQALCCICGQVRTVSKRYSGRRAGAVYGPANPERLREWQSRGFDLDVEPYWRHLNTLKCRNCGEWTRHAVITAGLTAAADEDKPADERLRWNPSGEEIKAELERLDVEVCWIKRMRHAAVWLEDECIVILNREVSDAALGVALVELLPEIWRETVE